MDFFTSQDNDEYIVHMRDNHFYYSISIPLEKVNNIDKLKHCLMFAISELIEKHKESQNAVDKRKDSENEERFF